MLLNQLIHYLNQLKQTVQVSLVFISRRSSCHQKSDQQVHGVLVFGENSLENGSAYHDVAIACNFVDLGK